MPLLGNCNITCTYSYPFLNHLEFTIPSPAMAARNPTIPLTAREAGPESPTPAATVILPPISRKKQAAVVSSAFGAIALTIGYNQCFGVFQEYYLSPDQDVLVPSPASQASPPTALLAFVGTLCYGLTWAGGILVNPVISRIEHGIWGPATPASRVWRRRMLRLLTTRTITVSGVLMMSVGFALASATGGGAGGLVLSPAFSALLNTIGGRRTLQIYAIFNLIAGLPIAWSVPRSRFAGTGTPTTNPNNTNPQPIATSRPSTHLTRPLSTHPTLLLSALAAFLQAAGAQLPLAFIPSYSVVLGLGASRGASLLAASSAVNAVARVLTGYVGDRWGRQNMLVVTMAVAGGSVLGLWLGSAGGLGVRGVGGEGEGGLGVGLWLAFVVVYSFAIGGYYALFPALVADVFGIRQYAAVNAFILMVRGLGTMFGSPVGGQLLGAPDEGARAYVSVAYWDGALLMAATVCCAGVRWADAKGKGWRWIA
ncbi:major facilitator superfamily domain-containing protein [Chaetomium tenue]|uniref:Major facilitator superfamily domain-containing protein n=1 Tax=Chaetomium tenue TaxID=1854479 RepID=A0ACB7PIQ5_9PEZI|nr:major facilitator superfamily domain-containing protein [Chaetomium globosum]